MKGFILFGGVLLLIFSGCKSDTSVEPVEAVNYSGQYQSVPYSIVEAEPVVTLLISQDGHNLSGTGNWNGMVFNFTGTLINKHLIVSFDLKNTNLGDLNCHIDAWFGNSNSLAGGYQMWNNSQIINNAIRFKCVELAN